MTDDLDLGLDDDDRTFDMDLGGSTDPRSAALQHAVAAARRLGADDVEVSYAGTTTEFVRFASSHFNQVGETHEDLIRVRVLVGGRMGQALGASLRPGDLERTADQAMALARLAPPLDVALSFGEPDPAGTEPPSGPPAAPGRAATSPDPETEDGSRGRLDALRAPAELRRAFDRAAGGLALFGALKRRRRVLAVRTAAGLRRWHEGRTVQLDVIAQAGDGSGWAGWFGADDERVDTTGLVERAADTARRGRSPVALEPGRFDVVLAPAAVAELLEWMSMASFGGKSVLEGASLLAGRAGSAICSPAVTLSEVVGPTDAPFDAEGTWRRQVDFIAGGRAGVPVTDLLTAARLGDPGGSTGHAAAIGPHGEGDAPAATHVVLAPGDKSEAELIGMVDRGLYVTRLHYVNGLLDTRRATMTGMTRDGTFVIEGGQLGRGAKNLRFTDSVLDALGDERLGGIGNQVVAVPTWWGPGGQLGAPALLLRGLSFSGASR